MPTNLGSPGVGFFFFLLPWSAPLPQMVVLSSNISAEIEPTRKAFLLLPANTPPPPPHPFFLSSACGLNNLALFWVHSCGPFSSSPLCGTRDGGPREHRLTFSPSTVLLRGVGAGGGGRKTNRIYLGWLRHQLNTWAERQRLFRKSPGRQGDPHPLPPGVQKITGAENKALA